VLVVQAFLLHFIRNVWDEAVNDTFKCEFCLTKTSPSLVLQLSSQSSLLLLVLSCPADYSTELLHFGMIFVVCLMKGLCLMSLLV
jgi:hypothetical protein